MPSFWKKLASFNSSRGVPGPLAAKITAAATVPTIGIGAGKDCDGQVLVINDMLGINQGHIPKFVKRFADLGPAILEALRDYKSEVEEEPFRVQNTVTQ